MAILRAPLIKIRLDFISTYGHTGRRFFNHLRRSFVPKERKREVKVTFYQIFTLYHIAAATVVLMRDKVDTVSPHDTV